MITHKTRSVAGTAMLGIALTFGGSSAAAILAPVAVAQEANTSLINPDARGSIEINKRLNPESTTDPTGLPGQAASGKPLAGVNFSIQQVTDVDLTTNAGYLAASALDANAAATRSLGPAQTITTDADGKASLTDLPVGLYYVTEADTANANIGGTPVRNIIPSKPFLVYLPTSDNSATGADAWRYDISVFPKNSSTTVSKTVYDQNVVAGGNVDYSINSTVPAVQTGKQMTSFVVTDDLDDVRLGLRANQADAADAIDVVLSTGTELIKGTDYTVTDTDTSDGVNFRVEFTTTGLAKLTAAGPTATVTTNVHVLMKAVAADETSTDIINDATIEFNNGTDSQVISVPDDEVPVTKRGVLQIEKQDASNNAAKLGGAVFELYRSSDINNLGAPLTVDGESQWTTDAQGRVAITGLQVTDFQNGAAVVNNDKYFLKEVKAPAGYELLAKPVEITFTQASVAADDAVTGYNTAVAQLATIDNAKSNVPKLPITGGKGIALLLGSTVVALLAGVFATRKKKA